METLTQSHLDRMFLNKAPESGSDVFQAKSQSLQWKVYQKIDELFLETISGNYRWVLTKRRRQAIIDIEGTEKNRQLCVVLFGFKRTQIKLFVALLFYIEKKALTVE